MKILIINGVNLNMLGKRSKEYGTVTLAEIESEAKKLCGELGMVPEFFTSNFEGEIVEKVQMTDADAIIINAGAHTHYSYAIADALKDKTCFKVEVHLTNVQAREEFRARSVISPVVDGVIAGFGKESYMLAVRAAVAHTKK
ncbi:MAG: 3-dehydroquinate dehydratase [Clostridia bacterium]|nr:3-dehydroquinate dehydratase [Clostridia bacterium]